MWNLQCNSLNSVNPDSVSTFFVRLTDGHGLSSCGLWVDFVRVTKKMHVTNRVSKYERQVRCWCLPAWRTLADADSVVKHSSADIALVCPGPCAPSKAQLIALAMRTSSLTVISLAAPAHALVAPFCHITNPLTWARSRVFVGRYEVLAAVCYRVPVHRVVIAQCVVLLNSHWAPQNCSQSPQTEFLQL